MVRLYSSEQLVELTLNTPYDKVIDSVEVYEAVLAEVLKDKGIEDVYITDIVRINDT